MLQASRRRRLDAEDRAKSLFEKGLARHYARVDELRHARDHARERRQFWTWLRSVFALNHAKRQAPRPARVTTRSNDREEILAAGISGEQIAETGLADILGDDWTLLRGYRNRRGEIDHLLLGPMGLVAIEVKHRNATVHCNGDDWWFTKYDRYGTPVEEGILSDRRGRSPSRQLNEPADQLQRFLGDRGCPIPVQRVVLFTHPRSKLGDCRNATVHIAISVDSVAALLAHSAQAIPAGQLVRLRQLIERDHRFHEANRLARRRLARRRLPASR
jgi:hypothetical protein